MCTAPVRPSALDTTPMRDRGDACPGALRLHTADDGALARVRVPGGILSAAQARALARAARRLGDGELHLTSRGNVQLRGLRADCGRELAELLDAAGLLPSHRHERVRNVVASPLAGLDGYGHGDLRPWLRELDGMLCASETAHALSGRFLFALDDGRGDTAGLGADVTLTARGDGTAALRIGPESSCVLQLPSSDAPLAALRTAEAFLRTPEARRGELWRISELPGGAEELAAEVVRGLGAAAAVLRSGPAVDTSGGGESGGGESGGPPPGVVPGPRGDAALSVLAPLGRLDAAQWQALVAAAECAGSRELRLTPWRGVVVPGVPARRAGPQSRTLASAGLITDPASPRAGVGACAGRPGCARSLADVRADATALTGPGPLPVYWSGCERRCGRPRGDRVEVVAEPSGYRVSLVRDGHIVRTSALTDRAGAAAEVAAARTGGSEGEVGRPTNPARVAEPVKESGPAPEPAPESVGSGGPAVPTVPAAVER
ncbi:precorrin-3B synthase [Streptomyces sp. Amel2xB2]|uniref:precorrin-3B synthase n=1 Tax=Streptomyces sp. Amel2xB2 TaxID=1305829 RepID=UPI0021AC38D1|nr:precorrin-3B synthase [Streptomyces sp. Amel2xB2]